MSKPRMCPHCRAFIDMKDKTCQYCGNELPMTAARRIERADRILSSENNLSFTTLMLILINAALFTASWILTVRFTGQSGLLGDIDGNVLLLLGAKYKPSILIHNEWWRLITAGFLHGGLLHLGFNSLSLYNLGPSLEYLIGVHRFIVIYLITGSCGFLVSMFWSNSLSIGASASVCGLIGALYCYARMSSNPMLLSLTKRWILGIVIFGLLFSRIDNAAHVGGFASGFGLMYVTGVPSTDNQTETLWKIAAIAAGIIATLAFLLAYRNFVQGTL